MTQFAYTVTNPGGIHARIACAFAEKAAGTRYRIRILYEGKEARAENIMELMRLSVPCGGTIRVEAEGEGGSEALEAMRRFCQDFV